MQWLAFNILIGNHDSHAKNISFLLSQGKWVLSPSYDLMSTAVYPGFTKDFAFSIGGQERPTEWRKKHFSLLEEQLGLKAGAFLEVLEGTIENLVLALPQVEYECGELLPGGSINKKIIQYTQKMVTVLDQKVLR